MNSNLGDFSRSLFDRAPVLLAAWMFFVAGLNGSKAGTPPAAHEPPALGGAQCSEASGYDKDRRYDAIIVGAGIAGIAAARELEHLNRSVLMLEANGRIGGRAFSGKIGDGGTPIDYGGAWIHGVASNPLTGLADAMGFKRERSELDVPYYIGSRQASKEELEVFDSAVSEYEDALDLAAKSAEDQRALAEYACGQYRKGIPREQVCRDLQRRIPYSRIAAASDLCRARSQPLPPDSFCKLANKDIRIASDVAERYVPSEPRFKDVLPLLIANAGPLESATELNESSAVETSQFAAGEDDLVDKSMGAFVEKLGEGLPVCLNTPVTRIDYAADGVEVSAGGRVYRGGAALVTVSVGVLQGKKIAFAPELPARKQEAIEHLQMGNMQKVIVPFKADIFPTEKKNTWVVYEGDLPPDALAFARSEKLPLLDDKRVVMAFVIKPLDTPIAIGFFGGDWARALEKRCQGRESGSGKRSESGCDDMAIGIARSALSAMFGEKQVDEAIEPEGIHLTRWSLDATSFGAYSVAEPGNWFKHAILAEPVKDANGRDRLFFAGEGTARPIFNGSFPGAYESGLRAAREINAAMLAALESAR
jgi:monoamine oxidase